MKMKLRSVESIEGKEMFEIDQESLKSIVDDCCCKHVSRKQHELLRKEFADIFGFYSYVRDKKRIKPFIVISKAM